MGMRQCPFCGKFTLEQVTQCPFCRESLTSVPQVTGFDVGHEGANKQIRRGLIYMVLAAAAHYFLAGYSPVQFPLTVIPQVTELMIPFLFLAGVGLVILGIYRRFTS